MSFIFQHVLINVNLCKFIRCQNAVIQKLHYKNNNKNFSVACLRKIKPIDEKKIISLSVNKGNLITIEESTLPGGIGSAISDILVDNEILTPLLRIGIKDRFVPVGDKLELSKICKIDPINIYNEMIVRWPKFEN